MNGQNINEEIILRQNLNEDEDAFIQRALLERSTNKREYGLRFNDGVIINTIELDEKTYSEDKNPQLASFLSAMHKYRGESLDIKNNQQTQFMTIDRINALINIIPGVNKAEIEKLEKSVERLQVALDSEAKELESTFKPDYNELKEIINRTSNTLEGNKILTRKEIEQKTAEIEERQKSNITLEEEKKRSEESIKEIEKSVDELTKQWSDKCKELLNAPERALILKKLEKMLEEIDQKNAEIAAIQSRIYDIEDEIKTNELAIATLKNDRNELKRVFNKNIESNMGIVKEATAKFEEKYGIKLSDINMSKGKQNFSMNFGNAKSIQSILMECAEKDREIAAIQRQREKFKPIDKNDDRSVVVDKVNNFVSSIDENMLNLLNNPKNLNLEIIKSVEIVKGLKNEVQKDFIDQEALTSANERIEILRNLIANTDEEIAKALVEQDKLNPSNRVVNRSRQYRRNINELEKKIRSAKQELSRYKPNSYEYHRVLYRISNYENEIETYKNIRNNNLNSIDIPQSVEVSQKVDKLKSDRETYQIELQNLEARKHSNGFIDIERKAYFETKLNEEQEKLDKLNKIAKILNGRTLDSLKNELLKEYKVVNELPYVSKIKEIGQSLSTKLSNPQIELPNDNELRKKVDVQLTKAGGLALLVGLKNPSPSLLDRIKAKFAKKHNDVPQKEVKKEKAKDNQSQLLTNIDQYDPELQKINGQQNKVDEPPVESNSPKDDIPSSLNEGVEDLLNSIEEDPKKDVDVSLEKAGLGEWLTGLKSIPKNLYDKIRKPQFTKATKKWLAGIAGAAVIVAGGITALKGLKSNIPVDTSKNNNTNIENTIEDTKATATEVGNKIGKSTNLAKDKLQAVRAELEQMADDALSRNDNNNVNIENKNDDINAEDYFTDMINKEIFEGLGQVANTSPDALNSITVPADKRSYIGQKATQFIYNGEYISPENAYELVQQGEEVAVLSSKDGTPLGWFSTDDAGKTK